MIRTEHREDNWEFKFVKYAPENQNDKKMPLILQLHGAGERGEGKDDLSKVDIHGFSNVIKDKDYECIFIMPQCPLDSFWVAKTESLKKFIDKLVSEYNVDEHRVYLTGLSMGGFGTWYMAMAYPELFAAIAPVCGGGMEWNAKVLKMPVKTFHGIEDGVVSVSHTDRMVEALQKSGGDVIYTRLEGVGHNAWIYAYNEDLYNWLVSKRK